MIQLIQLFFLRFGCERIDEMPSKEQQSWKTKTRLDYSKPGAFCPCLSRSFLAPLMTIYLKMPWSLCLLIPAPKAVNITL